MSKQPIEIIASMLGGEKNPSNLKAASVIMDQLEENGYSIRTDGALKRNVGDPLSPAAALEQELRRFGGIQGADQSAAASATAGNQASAAFLGDGAVATLRRESERMRAQANNLDRLAVALGKLAVLREGQGDHRIDEAIQYLIYRHRT